MGEDIYQNSSESMKKASIALIVARMNDISYNVYQYL